MVTDAVPDAVGDASDDEEILLPRELSIIVSALSVVLTEIDVYAEFYLTPEGYSPVTGYAKIIICGEGVTEALDNFVLKSLESAVAFITAVKLGYRVRVILSVSETPPQS